MFGTARRSTTHVLSNTGGAFVPRYRVIAACAVSKGQDGRNHHCYHGDVLDWLSDEEAARFLSLNLVEPIDADAAADAPAEPVDLDAEETDTPTADSDAVSECVAVLERLLVPSTAGAPACRTALRGNGHRFGNSVVAEAVKRRKGLSATATAADDEEFEAVVLYQPSPGSWVSSAATRPTAGSPPAPATANDSAPGAAPGVPTWEVNGWTRMTLQDSMIPQHLPRNTC